MSKRLEKFGTSEIEQRFQLGDEYIALLNEIKSKLQTRQLKAATAVNRELLQYYWEVGKLIIEKQSVSKWGDKLYDVLSRDLTQSFPDAKGFSKTNLKNMRMFAAHYPVGQFSQALPDQLSWTHHIVLLHMINSENLYKKQWYAEKTIEKGWSYRKLKEEIQSQLYERQADKMVKTTNFYEKLPAPTSNLAHEMIKDPYKFHFLTVGEEAHEQEVQSGLLFHVKQFLMELDSTIASYAQ